MKVAWQSLVLTQFGFHCILAKNSYCCMLKGGSFELNTNIMLALITQHVFLKI